MFDLILIGQNAIEKHLRYKELYKPNSMYWGLGIEDELYLEFDKKYEIDNNEFTTNHKRERYSVDYYSNYKPDDLKKAFEYAAKLLGNKKLPLPILLNSHSFTNTDANNKPKTKYTKKCENNPEFSGKTLIETLAENNSYFKQDIYSNWVFDGDTIEFPTYHFYNATLFNVITELNKNKQEFLENLNNSLSSINAFNKLEFGKVKIMDQNHSFATYMTNMKNVAMFNNGTLHYNLTLPTELDENGLIKNRDKFIYDHNKAIKIIQWAEPLMLAVYGSPDPFSTFAGFSDKTKYSNASVRCAVSRYIGIGSYDSDTMATGKILTIPKETCAFNDLEYWWFNQYYKNNAYTELNDIGMDINFNKHYNHGIEIRFLDHLTKNSQIAESFAFIIYLMDFILESDKIQKFGNPIKNRTWNNLMLNVMKHGKKYNLAPVEIMMYNQLFNIRLQNTNIVQVYQELLKIFSGKFEQTGIFSALTLKKKSNPVIERQHAFTMNSFTKVPAINISTSSTPSTPSGRAELIAAGNSPTPKPVQIEKPVQTPSTTSAEFITAGSSPTSNGSGSLQTEKTVKQVKQNVEPKKMVQPVNQMSFLWRGMRK